MRSLKIGRACLGIGLFATTVLLTPSSLLAIEGCKVKANARDGALLVSAKAVAANPRWGFTPAAVTNSFANEATCVLGGSAKKCELGGPGTATRITPPDLCTLYVTDDTGTVCAAYIKGCVPGVRNALAGSKGYQGDPGPKGDKGDAGQQGAAGPAVTLKAFDANGNPLGIVVSPVQWAGTGVPNGIIDVFVGQIGKFTQIWALAG